MKFVVTEHIRLYQPYLLGLVLYLRRYGTENMRISYRTREKICLFYADNKRIRHPLSCPTKKFLIENYAIIRLFLIFNDIIDLVGAQK